MKTVTIGFSTRTGNLLSWAIRTVEGRPYSHVYIRATDDSAQTNWLFEATIPDVCLTNPDIFFSVNKAICQVNIPVTDEENQKVLQFFAANTGKSYATNKLFGILYKRIAKNLGFNLKSPTDDGDKTEECSEAGALVLKILGMQTTEDLEAVGPGWVFDQATLMANQRKSNG